MKRKIYLLILTLFTWLGVQAQITGYGDVGVIINDNSPASMQIGNYFGQVRNIPPENMIHIHTVTDEVIDTLEFRNIQQQVKSYLLQAGLENRIRYLVTTKGVPFDISVDGCTVGGSNSSFAYCSSVESELTLLFCADSTRMLRQGNVLNPYFADTVHRNQNPTDILLVSRLDGENTEAVYNLIDRSGPQTYVNKSLSKFIFDISLIEDTVATFDSFANLMYPAIDTLNNHGWKTIFHGDYELPSGYENVLGFVGCIWGVTGEHLNFSWTNGSFSEMMVIPPEFTFYDSLNTQDNLLLADVIGEGCSSGAGYIHAYFASQATDYGIFFSRYTDQRENAYNLAESYFMATKTLSWMNILVGDPKTTITTVGAGAVGDNMVIGPVQIYPNPATDFVNIGMYSDAEGRVDVLIYDLMGTLHKKVSHNISEGTNDLEVSLRGLDSGLYFISIQNSGNLYFVAKKLMVR